MKIDIINDYGGKKTDRARGKGVQDTKIPTVFLINTSAFMWL